MSRILKIAHRGYSARYPENTLLAFEKAIEAGADMIELDIHLSADGYPVVIHDDYIDRTSNGSGMVKEMTLEELRRYDYRNHFEETPPQVIPLLEEVIELISGKLMLNIEMKNCPNIYPGIEEKVADIIVRRRLLEDCIVSSFDHYSLENIKELDPQIKTGMLYGAVWVNFTEEIHRLGVSSVHPGVDVASPRQLDYAVKAGLKVYPWVAHDSITVNRLVEQGNIDGIMVNELKLLDGV